MLQHYDMIFFTSILRKIDNNVNKDVPNKLIYSQIYIIYIQIILIMFVIKYVSVNISLMVMIRVYITLLVLGKIIWHFNWWTLNPVFLNILTSCRYNHAVLNYQAADPYKDPVGAKGKNLFPKITVS